MQALSYLNRHSPILLHILGGWDLKGAISSIFKFDIDENKWHNTTYDMSRPRSSHGISVVDFENYSKACLGPVTG